MIKSFSFHTSTDIACKKMPNSNVAIAGRDLESEYYAGGVILGYTPAGPDRGGLLHRNRS
jgi:hypothetical protein